METRGRKRKYSKHIPAHIEQTKLPNNCYWDNSGSGHWYTTYKDETGRQRRCYIAGKHATLSDLHKIIEEQNGIKKDTFRWLSDLFMQSPELKQLAKNTQKGYRQSAKNIINHPTRVKKLLGDTSLSKWDAPIVQKLVDQIAVRNGPTAANAALRYTRRLFRWGKNRGYISINHAEGVESAKERKKQTLVSARTYTATLEYAKHCGGMKPKTKGSAPAYLWIAMELAYLCRLRGIEVITLAEDKATNEGIICERTKGSRTNIATWNDRLKSAWNAAIEHRNKIWKEKKRPIQHKKENRPVIVGLDGCELKKSSFDTAWQRFIVKAIAEEVIKKEDRFSLHDLKRKGATDTKGTRQEKQLATGHKSAQMMDVYDKSVPVVKPSGE